MKGGSNPFFPYGGMDCFAEPLIGRACARTVRGRRMRPFTSIWPRANAGLSYFWGPPWMSGLPVVFLTRLSSAALVGLSLPVALPVVFGSSALGLVCAPGGRIETPIPLLCASANDELMVRTIAKARDCIFMGAPSGVQ